MNDYSHHVISREAVPFLAICSDASASAVSGAGDVGYRNFLGNVPAKELV